MMESATQSVNVVSGLTRSVCITVTPETVGKQQLLFKTLLSALAQAKIPLQVNSRMSLQGPVLIFKL